MGESELSDFICGFGEEGEKSEMLSSTLVLCQYSLGQLKADPGLLLDYLQKTFGSTTKDQLWVFPQSHQHYDGPSSAQREATGGLPDPETVFVGFGAMKYVRNLINALRIRPTLSPLFPSVAARLAQAFQTEVGANISLFEGIPLSAYPTDHVMQKPAVQQILADYQAMNNRPVFNSKVLTTEKTFVHHQMVLRSKIHVGGVHNFLDNPNLKIHPVLEANVVELMRSYLPGTRAAYDLFGNLYVSVQTLLALLTGHYYLPKYWCEVDHMIGASKQLVGVGETFAHRAVKIHLQCLADLEEQGIVPTRVSLSYEGVRGEEFQGNMFAWCVTKINRSANQMMYQCFQ